MRIILVLCLLISAACTVTPRDRALSAELDSWVGADPAELISILGEPDSESEHMWTWRKTSPGIAATTNVNTVISSGCSVPAGEGKVGTKSCVTGGGDTRHRNVGSTSIAPKDCRFYARLSDGVIDELEARTVSGRCTFNELSARSTPSR